MGLKFKTSRIETEWRVTYPPLRAQVLDLAVFAEELGIRDLVVTCLWRSPEENAAVGGKPTSLHQTTPIRAADIRRRMLSEDEVARLHDHWNQYKPSPEFGFNDEPAKSHLHLQVRV